MRLDCDTFHDVTVRPFEFITLTLSLLRYQASTSVPKLPPRSSAFACRQFPKLKLGDASSVLLVVGQLEQPGQRQLEAGQERRPVDSLVIAAPARPARRAGVRKTVIVRRKRSMIQYSRRPGPRYSRRFSS